MMLWVHMEPIGPGWYILVALVHVSRATENHAMSTTYAHGD